MGRRFSVRALTAEQAAQAFPLVQLVAPGLALEKWLSFAQPSHTDGGSNRGIIAAQDADGYIYGLFQFQIMTDLKHDRLLVADHIIALDPVDRGGAIAALIDALDDIAAREGCGVVHVQVPHMGNAPTKVDEALVGSLREAGFMPEGLQLCKAVRREAKTRR